MVENFTAVHVKVQVLLFFPFSSMFTICSSSPPTFLMRPQKANNCSCKLAGMFCAVCQGNLRIHQDRVRGKTKLLFFYLMSPFNLNSTKQEIPLRKINVQRSFLCFDVLDFTCFPPQSSVLLLPVLDLWKFQGSLTSWTRDREHGQCQQSSSDYI